MTTTMSSRAGEPTIAGHRAEVAAWLEQHEPELLAARDPSGSLETEMAYNRRLSARLWEEGFTRWGWPESTGGRGGSALLRAVVAEELTLRGLAHQNIYLMPEVLGVPFAQNADPVLARQFLPPYIAGEDWWCQGFSEPGAGSDLASLATRAAAGGDHFVVSGQKVWTSLAQFAQRCILLARTGAPESAHRGITAFLVDMDSPGVAVRPLAGMHGEDEFSEVFFDEVVVPVGRVIGAVDGGWSVAMQILACERATIFWTRAAWLFERLGRLVDLAGEADEPAVGEAFQQLVALRARSRRTQYSRAQGCFDPAASSVDKVLMASAEQAVFDAALACDATSALFGDDRPSVGWRTEYLYSRAASIYGGTGEIQRNIIAQRLLGLPRA